MNLFYKYTPLFYTGFLFLLNMKLIGNNVLYPLLAFSMVMVALYTFLNPKIYLKKYFLVFLVINIVNLVYLVLFHQTLESFMYIFSKFTLFSIIIIGIYNNQNFYINYFPKFLTYFISAILVIGVFIHVPEGSRYGGLLGNPNSLGIVSALLFGIVFLKNKLSTLDKIMLLIAIVMILLSGSRNALLGIGLAMILKSGFTLKNMMTVAVGLFALSVSYLYISDSLGMETAMERVNISSDASTELRKMELYYGFKTVMLSPIYGNGLEKYGYIDSSLFPASLSHMVPGPHNSFLALWIQYGIPMGTFLFFFILIQIYKVFRWKGKDKSLFFIMAYFFIAATFESYLFAVNGFETMIFWIAFAINMLIYYNRQKIK